MAVTTPAHIPEMFSLDWYNEYFRRAASSEASATFCEKVYGKNLCQHGMMDMQELDFLVSLIPPSVKVLEIGCSNGFITEYIHDRAGCSVLGIDFSDVAIAQARERTRHKSETLQFECVDLTKGSAPGDDFDIVLLTDSIYFLGEFSDVLPRFIEKLNDSGKLILQGFQLKEADDSAEILQPDQHRIGKALRALGHEYQAYDFTKNVRNFWLNSYRISSEMRQDFVSEGNEFLYEARIAESSDFKTYVDNDAISRFLYVANK